MKPKTLERHVGIEIECMFKNEISVQKLQRHFNLKGFRGIVTVGTDGSVRGPVSDPALLARCKVVYGEFGAQDYIYPANIKPAGFGTWAYKGFEIRVLAKTSNYRKIINAVCKIIQAHGGFVNHTCGLHVHLDMRQQVTAVPAFKNLVMAQDKFFPLLEKSRQRNSYARRVGTSKIKTPLDWEDLFYGVSRYSSVNPKATTEHGTLEVRAHEGTLDANIINSWIAYLWAVVDNRSPDKKLERYGKVKTESLTDKKA